ncbi:transcription initiation factor IIB [candidate division MSBL1 archaeon SCGC-AAA382F02]|uniref:Transcription initiation factor IIB n=1 Tax=candidate division MSBL1 archaeon SCGC-AAA382F02 TaxID=1698282 RepID=A0A133VIQ5_9EURY|nr:transcription initiation factor IIB [candidate division MSBL1 archaeon SCGC-AAA382F02]
MVKSEVKEKSDDSDGGGIKECPACGNDSFIQDYQKGSKVCSTCGCIIKEDVKDRGPEWRAFSQEQREERSRGGAPMTYTIHDKGLSTKIDWRNRDGRGKSLSPKRRSQMYRLRKWQRRARVSNADERNLAYALSELDRMSSRLGLPKKVREAAAMIYREAVKESLIRGRSIEGVSSAALYAGCRKCQVPRTLEEIAGASRVDKREISRSYRFISRELDIHLMPTNPVSYVSRFGSELGISGEARTKAIELIKKAKDKKLTSGRGPTGIAAAAIYIASVMAGERRTQRDTAEVANVTEVTVRNRYKELVEELNLDVDV